MPVRGKGYLGFQPFFPAWNRLFRSWIVIHSGLRFFVKWEINFHSMWPRKMMENPPPPHRFTTRAGPPDGSWRHFLFLSPEPALSLSIARVIWPKRAQPISYPESSGFLVSGITLPKKPEYDPKTTRRRPEDSSRPKTDPVDTGYEIASSEERHTFWWLWFPSFYDLLGKNHVRA